MRKDETQSEPCAEFEPTSTSDDENIPGDRAKQDRKIIDRLTRQHIRYRQRNKELAHDCHEQQVALVNLQHDYAQLKLELAKARSNVDMTDVAKDEAIAAKDLKILQLVRERDDLTHQVRELRLVEVRLESSLHRKDSRFWEIVGERDKLEEELRFVTKERDDALIKLKQSENTTLASSRTHGRKLLERFAMGIRGGTDGEPCGGQILPIDAIAIDSTHHSNE